MTDDDDSAKKATEIREINGEPSTSAAETRPKQPMEASVQAPQTIPEEEDDEELYMAPVSIVNI